MYGFWLFGQSQCQDINGWIQQKHHNGFSRNHQSHGNYVCLRPTIPNLGGRQMMLAQQRVGKCIPWDAGTAVDLNYVIKMWHGSRTQTKMTWANFAMFHDNLYKLIVPIHLETEDMRLVEWWANAAFSLYAYFKSHTEGTMTMCKRSVIDMLNKQQLNMWS